VVKIYVAFCSCRDLKSLEKFIEGKLGNEIPEETPKVHFPWPDINFTISHRLFIRVCIPEQ
jgi:hypothetical protein